MAKKVTLSYTIPLDELENEVGRLFRNTSTRLSNIIENKKSLTESSTLLVPETLNNIGQLKEQLETVNTMYSEIHDIVVQYLQYVSAPPQESDKTIDEDIERLRAMQEDLKREITTIAPSVSESE